jgi:hypothetical protein
MDLCHGLVFPCDVLAQGFYHLWQRATLISCPQTNGMKALAWVETRGSRRGAVNMDEGKGSD